MKIDIEALAREAGFGVGEAGEVFVCRKNALETLAKLVVERCAQECDKERQEFTAEAARNDGRQSDMAFGSVNSSERIASAIRALVGE